MLHLNSGIPDNEARKILNLACFSAASVGKVTPDSLIAHAEKLEKKYLSTPKTKFRLVTSISVDFTAEPVTFRAGTVEISFGKTASPKAERCSAELIEDVKKSVFGELPRFYSQVTAVVKARNPDEAATHALNRIDLIRAIWNLWHNRGRTIRVSSGARSPVNVIILGPIHTLHKPAGELATDSWWYEPTYRGPVSVWHDPQRCTKMLMFTKNVRVALRKIPYRSLIEIAMVRYARALDSRDWNSCFLELWSILEGLTGTSLKDNHKITVRRSAMLFKDWDYSMQVLHHLRSYRNLAVHGGKEGQHIEVVMYQAKNFVEVLLEFHLARAGQFKSITEVAAFLDAAPGLEEIDRQIKRLKTVKKYLTA